MTAVGHATYAKKEKSESVNAVTRGSGEVIVYLQVELNCSIHVVLSKAKS